jgi:hypothetical protein
VVASRRADDPARALVTERLELGRRAVTSPPERSEKVREDSTGVCRAMVPTAARTAAMSAAVTLISPEAR